MSRTSESNRGVKFRTRAVSRRPVVSLSSSVPSESSVQSIITAKQPPSTDDTKPPRLVAVKDDESAAEVHGRTRRGRYRRVRRPRLRLSA